jgi:hypothetical protein
MGFLSGLTGAILGAVVGIVATFFAVAASSDGNDIADGFGLMGLTPIGIVLGAILGIVLALKLRWYARGNWCIKAARRKVAFTIVGSVLAVPALVAGLLWGQQQLRKPPPDQQLLSNFDHHHAIFDQLARMTQVDKGLQSVGYNWTDPSNPQKIGVSPARVDIYRRLLDSVHCHRGFDTYELHGAAFWYWGHGSSISDDEDKGYAYLTAPPTETLLTLNECRPDEENEVKAYRHIEGCWYLYYDFIPG